MMTTSFSNTTTKRAVAAAAAVAAASTLAACGADSKTAADAPTLSASSSTSTTASTTPSATTSPSASSTSSSAPSAPTTHARQSAAVKQPAHSTKRAARSQTRTAAQAAPKPVVTYTNWSQAENVPNKTVYVYSSALPKGTSKVTQAGHDGLATVTYKTGKLGRKYVSNTVVDAKVTRSAVRRVITIGTGVMHTQQVSSVAPKQAAPQQSVQQVTPKRTALKQAVSRSAQRQAPARQQTSTAAAGSGNAAMWNNIASCESTNNWSANTGNGFYGGLQFTQQTWAGFGGTAYAPRADLATPAQQMAIADKVLAVQGRGAWPVCGR